MLRRLLLGQPRREEIKDAKKPETYEAEKRSPTPMTKPTPNDMEEKSEDKDDLFDSDSETDSSGTDDSDTETLDNSSRAASYEDCSGDVLEWKGFEVVRNEKNGKSNGSSIGKHQSQWEKVKQNPFTHAFEFERSETPQIRDDGIKVNNDDENSIDGNKENISTTTTNNNVRSDNNNDQRNNKEFENNTLNTNIQTNTKETGQSKGSKTTTENTNNKRTAFVNVGKPKCASNPTTKTNNNINNKKEINNPTQCDITKPAKFGLSKVTSAQQQSSSQNGPTNRKSHNARGNGLSRSYSIRENQQKSTIKGKSFTRYNTGGKSTKASADTKWHQSIENDKAGLTAQKIGNREKQRNLNSSHVSVKDLEKILGVDLAELQEVIKKYKSEDTSTKENCQGENDVSDSNSVSSEIVKDNLVGGKKMQDGHKKGENEKTNNETADNKDEISSDSGVSEPDAHSTDIQPHYVTLKAIAKRKEYLEGQIRKLEDRVAVMEDHKKDIQFVYDLFDLHSDGLSKVERSNGGIASVPNLKRILACQLSEMDEGEFKAKLKSLEDLGIPNFSEINATIEKLRKRVRHTLDDERKCRSKGVQKLRFEIGKVQGMCEAVLDLVYTAE